MTADLPSFRKPPVVEVVFGVMFSEVANFTSAHVGQYWGTVSKKYPKASDHPPLDQVLESVERPGVVQFQFAALPPLRRTWFASEDGRNLVQVQADRFHYNVKRDLDSPYVRFRTTNETFFQEFNNFSEFVGRAAASSIQPVQFELAYVNVIPQGELFDGPGTVGRVLKHLNWSREDGGLLRDPQLQKWSATFEMPERRGRLHVQLTHGHVDRASVAVPALQLQLTARGFEQNLPAWFESAHEWIVRGFTELTTSKAHEVWEREA